MKTSDSPTLPWPPAPVSRRRFLATAATRGVSVVPFRPGLPPIPIRSAEALGGTPFKPVELVAGSFLDHIPRGADEIPLVLQDRSFLPDGSLDYPAMWMEHFFGDKILVNGKVWPYLDVTRGKYRFRIVNGSGSRTYRLSLTPTSGSLTFTVIDTVATLLSAAPSFTL